MVKGSEGQQVSSLFLKEMPLQGSHLIWKTLKTWKNESTPGKPGNIIEF